MVKKHIKRDYSSHRRSIIRPTNEYCKLEIFSYDHPETMYYTRYRENLTGENIAKTNWLAWLAYKSEDETNRFKIHCKYVAPEFAQYRVDILYLNLSDEDYTGFIQIFDKDEKIKDDDYLFDGETNVVKRMTAFYELEGGEYKFTFRLPYNTLFLGAVIRKIKYYSGDNIDSAGTNLMFLSSTVSKSGMVKPAEISISIGYDDAFECLDSKSGFYMDYMDEMNVYVKDNEDEIKQIFGGYISSILPDTDRTKLTITGADRLIDGQNKFIMDSMYLLGGTSKSEEYDYELYHDFSTYGEALKFLCDIHETTLKNNINENYLVNGEAYETGLAITFGKQGNAQNVHATEMTVEENETFVMVRNSPDASKYQTAYVYDVRDYNIEPVDITDFPNFYLTYGLGDPKQESGGSGGVGNADGLGSPLLNGIHSFVVGADDNGWGNEQARINQVIDALEAKGHSAESAGVDPSAITRYGSSNSVKGKIGVFIGGGQDGGVFYDFVQSYYNYKYMIVIFCSDTATTDKWITCNGLKNTNNYIDPRQGYSGAVYASGVENYTPYEWASMHRDKLAYACGPLGCSFTDVVNNFMALFEGGGSSGGSTSTTTPESVFQEISDEAFQYDYCLGCGSSSWGAMQSCGYGDCWAFSEFIYTRLKERGVAAKIMEYNSGIAGNHRSVAYKNSAGEWVDFPYREYGWNTRYNNMLNNTSNSLSGAVIQSCDGNGIEQATGGTTSGSGKIITGYDKDKPLQFYIELVFSTDKVNTHSCVINFTAKSTYNDSYTDEAFKGYWINNVVKQATVNAKEYMSDIMGDDDQELKYYIHSIRLKSPLNSEAWYQTDENTQDEASCKMDLYGLGFNQGTIVNPADLSSCGKSIISQMESLVKDSGYLVDMEYAQHRKDDVINFMVDNQTEPSYTAKEGDDNNILSWGSISYTPVSNLFNNSIFVFKKNMENGQYYRFVNTKDSTSVLSYGEQSTLRTTSEVMTDREAYYNSRKKNDKYNPRETFTYTITVPYTPDIDIGDLVKVVADAKKLNTLKRVESVKHTYDISKIPRLQTTLGLGELEPDLQLKKTLREIRKMAKQESTLFSTTAHGIDDKNLYQWEN